MRLLVLAAAVVAVVGIRAPSLHAQPFPAPGTGPYTWEQVGDRPLSITGFMFTQDGRVVGSNIEAFVFTPAPAGPPSGAWRMVSTRIFATNGLLALGGGVDTLVVSQRRGLIERSTDGGLSWVKVFGDFGSGKALTGEPESLFEAGPGSPHPGRILAGAGETSAIGYSDDRGATWQLPDLSAFPLSQGTFVDFGAYLFRAMPSGRILAGGKWGVATTDDGGSSWAPTPLFLPFGYVARGLAAVATPGSSQTGAPACGLTNTALCDGAIAIGTDATHPDTQVWRTNDGGRSWSAPVPLPEPFDGLGAGYPAGIVPLGTEANGLGRAVVITGRGLVYVTRDGGQSWAAVGRMPITLDYNWARLVKLGPDGHLWAGTVNAGSSPAWMYRSREPADAAFPVAGEAPPEAEERVGVSVRPNPAGGRVEVVVRAAEAGVARVVVVDALGREVVVVLDGAVSAGETALPVETGSWPAGVYVVRASVGSQTATARLVVAR